MSEEEKWKKRLERERAARSQAEQLLEQKSSQLYEANLKLEEANTKLADDYHAEANKSARQDRKLKALYDSSIDGILLADETGGITQANQALCNILKEQEDHLRYKLFWDFISPSEKDLHLVSKARQQLLENGFTRFQCNLKNSYGAHIPCAVSVSSFLVDNESVMQAIVRDITDQQHAAQALERATTEAIQANQAKSMFLATMSHEIRTPLNGIIGFTDLMLQDELNEEQAAHLDIIKKSGGMLLSIINDILDFSKIENKQIELEEMDFSLEDVIESTLDIHAHTADTKNVELLYHIAPEISVGMRGDMGRLQQILLNLVSNALKFTEEGSVIITVTKASDNFIEIEVKDTGIGFSQEVADKLFSPFQQADASTTRKYGGTGLGLAICRELIELMGGSIQAEATLGKGAAFRILYPYVKSTRPIQKSSESVDLSFLKNLRVLVVDDNEINLTFMRARLSSWKMRVSTVTSGKEALKLVETGTLFDLYLIDMLMPEMDGLELAERLNTTLPTPPSMMLVTSARLAGDKAKAYQGGFQSVVYKPVHQRELLNELSRMLETKPEKEEVRKETTAVQVHRSNFALLVEDNPINAKLAKILVERLGLTVHVAHNGQEALEALRLKSIYSVIFMDMQMPVMDGLRATEEIRKGTGGEHYLNIPIVAMTANAMREDEIQCLEAGMNHFIAKPINQGLLKDVLLEIGII